MLQFPTFVYPQNIAIDADVPHSVQCVFNGDIMKSVWFRAYDYYTKGLVTTQHRIATEYNGGSGGITLSMSPFSNGNDYVYQMMYTQGTADGSANIYDMKALGGVVLGANGTAITLKAGIPNIYEWNVSNNVCSPTIYNNVVYAGAIIKIGAESRFIQSYNRKTGILTIESAFSSDVTGKSYSIMCNYLITPQYYFMCRATPTLTVTKALDRQATFVPPEIIVTGEYSQTDGDMIRYYTIGIYASRIEHDVSYTSSDRNLIQQSPKIYSQRIRFRFFNWLVQQSDETIYYTAVCKLVTQNGESVISATEFSITADNELVLYENLKAKCVNEYEPDYLPQTTLIPHYKKHQMVELSFSLTEAGLSADAPVDLYRQDLETGISTHLYSARNYAAAEQKVYDWSVPNRGKFRYVVLPRDRSTGVPYVASMLTTDIETRFMGYTVTKVVVEEASFSLPFLFIRESWEFAGEIDDTTTTQNLNRIVQAGHSRYTVTSSGEGNYLSGTLTADISYISCPDRKYKDTIDMVNAWRDFISQEGIFMLKSQKGDVLLVSVQGTPTVAYQENNPEIPSRISFDWVECDSINNYIVRTEGID